MPAALRRIRRRGRRPGARGQQPIQTSTLRRAEPRRNLANYDQWTVRLTPGQQQAADLPTAAWACALRPAHDRELAGKSNWALDPRPRAAGNVHGINPFGDYTLKPFFPRHREHLAWFDVDNDGGTTSTGEAAAAPSSSSSSRRCAYAKPVKSRSSRASRSNAKNRTGTERSNSARGRRRIGQRCCSRLNDGRPDASRATTSPSSTALRPHSASRNPWSSGNVDEASAPPRVYASTPDAATEHPNLKPSHLNSVEKPGPTGGSPSVGSIGAGGTGRSMGITRG